MGIGNSSTLITMEASKPEDSDTLIDDIREKLKQFYRLRFGLSSISATLYLIIFEYSDVDIFNLLLAPVFAFLSGAMSFLRWYWYNLPEYNLSKNKHINIFLKCLFNGGLAIFSVIGFSVAVCISASLLIAYMNTIVSSALGIIYFSKFILKLSQASVWLYRATKAEKETDRYDECWGRSGKYGWSALYCLAVLAGVGLSLFTDTISAGASKIVFAFTVLSIAFANTFYDEIKNKVRQWFQQKSSSFSRFFSWKKKTKSNEPEFTFPSFKIGEILNNNKISDRARLIKVVLFKAIHLNLNELTPDYTMSDGRKISDIDPLEYFSSLYLNLDELKALQTHIQTTYPSSPSHKELLNHLDTVIEETNDKKHLISEKYDNPTILLASWHDPNPWNGKFSYSDMKISLKALKSYCDIFNADFNSASKTLLLSMLDKKIELLSSTESTKGSGYFSPIVSYFFSSEEKNNDKKNFLIWLTSWIKASEHEKPALIINAQTYTIKNLNDLYSLLESKDKNNETLKKIYKFFTHVFSSSFESKGEVETLLKFTGYFIKIQSPSSSTKLKDDVKTQGIKEETSLKRCNSEPGALPSQNSRSSLTSPKKRCSSFSNLPLFFAKQRTLESGGSIPNQNSYNSVSSLT